MDAGGRPQKDESIQWDDAANNKTALAGARDSLVLLKNEGGFLPLDKSTVKNIVLVGPCADPAVVSGGGSGAINAFHPVSILAGLKEQAGSGVTVTRVPWTPPGLSAAMVKAAPSSGSWKAEYFTNQELVGAPTVSREEKTIDFKLKRKGGPVDGVPHDHFSARWTGTVRVEKSGPVVFGTAADDGARVFVDGNKVIDDWTSHAVRDTLATVNLEAGRDYPGGGGIFQWDAGFGDAVWVGAAAGAFAERVCGGDSWGGCGVCVHGVQRQDGGECAV